MKRIARKHARRRAAAPGGEAAEQWPGLLAALARDEQHHTLAGQLGELEALRQDPPPQVVVVIDEVDVLAHQACGPLGADVARLLLEQRRGPSVALVLAGSRPTATWIYPEVSA